jgi:IclR family transcriptional regulator, acetate operon repressor
MEMSTIGKALTLLDMVSQLDGDVGLSDVARLGSLDKATARRLLVELERYGFIEQDVESRKYRIGSAPVRLARIRESRYPFTDVAAPIVKMLAEEVGETVHLSEFSGNQLATIRVEESAQAHRVIVKIGTILPFHATASGLAFLAFCPPTEIVAALSKPLESFSRHTEVDPNKIRELLQEAAKRGFSIGQQGLEEGVISTAAPILAPNGRPVGTVAIAAPMVRANLKTMLEYGAKAVMAANNIAEKYYGTKKSQGTNAIMGEKANGNAFTTSKDPRHRNG